MLTDATLESKIADLMDDQDFRKLDRERSRFNLFEAMGAARRELNHSNFLSFLFSPARNHGLGSEPLLRFLRAVIDSMALQERPVRALELMVGDLDDALVYRERDNIDILIELKDLNLVVVIENKVGAKAGDGQLASYTDVVEARYPEHRHLFIFLTPDGVPPDHDRYVPFSYSKLAEILDDLARSEQGASRGDIVIILRHYIDMVRRQIVPDQRLQDLARTLYERHKEAFDYVFEARPQKDPLLTILQSELENLSSLKPDKHTDSILRFFPVSWEGVPSLEAVDPALWTKSGRTLLFEIKTYRTQSTGFSARVSLGLVLGPAPAEIRKRIYSAAGDLPKVFKGRVKPMGNQTTTIYLRDLLTDAAAKPMDMRQRQDAVSAAWADFIAADLPGLEGAVLKMFKP